MKLNVMEWGGEHSQTANDGSLVKVMAKLHDSVDIFNDLAKRSHVPEIQDYAYRQIAERRTFDEELRPELNDVRNEPADGTVHGLFRRLSKDLKSLLPGADDKMLVEVEHSETSLRAAYLEALEQNSASPDLRDKFHRQQAHVGRAQVELRSLRARARVRASYR